MTSTAPRVSIVVPAYNRERYLGLTLDSVLAQTLTSWELVVFDDGSRDGTSAVASRYAEADSRIRLVQGANGGVASARNRGFDATDVRSEFVAFLDSDDLWDPDTLEALAGELDAHPEFVSVYGLARCVDDEGRPIAGDDLEVRMRQRKALRRGRLEPLDVTEPTTFAAVAFHNWVGTPGVQLTRRTILDEVGPFDETTDPADDWDMVVRISRRGAIGFVDRPVLRWRRHPDTLTTLAPNWKQAHFAVRRKMLADPSNTDAQARIARDGYLVVSRNSLRRAGKMLTGGRISDAARLVATGGGGYVRYLRVAVPLRWRARAQPR